MATFCGLAAELRTEIINLALDFGINGVQNLPLFLDELNEDLVGKLGGLRNSNRQLRNETLSIYFGSHDVLFSTEWFRSNDPSRESLDLPVAKSVRLDNTHTSPHAPVIYTPDTYLRTVHYPRVNLAKQFRPRVQWTYKLGMLLPPVYLLKYVHNVEVTIKVPLKYRQVLGEIPNFFYPLEGLAGQLQSLENFNIKVECSVMSGGSWKVKANGQVEEEKFGEVFHKGIPRQIQEMDIRAKMIHLSMGTGDEEVKKPLSDWL